MYRGGDRRFFKNTSVPCGFNNQNMPILSGKKNCNMPCHSVKKYRKTPSPFMSLKLQNIRMQFFVFVSYVGNYYYFFLTMETDISVRRHDVIWRRKPIKRSDGATQCHDKNRYIGFALFRCAAPAHVYFERSRPLLIAMNRCKNMWNITSFSNYNSQLIFINKNRNSVRTEATIVGDIDFLWRKWEVSFCAQLTATNVGVAHALVK